MMRAMHLRALLVAVALLAGCKSSAVAPDPGSAPSAKGSPAAASTGTPLTARVGEMAPDFELPDLDGTKHRLSELRGKRVVLEWFNPECPFVKGAHTKGSLRDLAKRVSANGVVWLAINSGAEGKQGYGVEVNRGAKQRFGLDHPILMDPTGATGKAYGATNTPHMYVIDEKGVLVYRGAIDNAPDGEGESPAGGKLVNHVESALAELSAGKPVSNAETRAYGCSVKYASR
jgi:peroxiredoxin